MSRLDLRINYRARKYSDFIGQGKNLEIVKMKIISGRASPGFMIKGKYGTGKTSLSQVITKSLNCETPNLVTAEPCNRCDFCTLVDGDFTFPYDKGLISDLALLEYDGTRFSVETFNKLCGLMVYAFPRPYRVILIDEAHRMDMRLQEKFLSIIESNWFKERMVFIFVVADDNSYKVCEPLAQRLTTIQMVVPSTEEIIPWLKKICSKENINVANEEIFKIIAEFSQNIPRRCLGNLEKLAVLDVPLTTDLIYEVLEQ